MAHILQPLFAHSFGTVSGAGVDCRMFSSAGILPSTISFGPPRPSFDRFVGTMMPLDSLEPCRGGLVLLASPTDPSPTGGGWLQGIAEAPIKGAGQVGSRT